MDGEFEARAARPAAAVTEEKRLVDFLDVDAPLYRLDRIGDFEDSASGFLRVGPSEGEGVNAVRPSLGERRAKC
jgi:hypothetical protein